LSRVEIVVAQEFVQVPVKVVRAGFGFYLDRAGAVLAVLRAVVRSQYFHFRDGVDTWVDIDGSVAAVIQRVAAVDFKVVVFGAATVDAERHRRRTLAAFILARLVGDAGGQSNQLGKVAAIQF
jgi:hypothetical protein